MSSPASTARIAARLFLWSHEAFKVVRGSAQALFEGFWMGVLSEGAVDAICEISYGSGANYTGGGYLDSGLQFWEALAFQAWFGSSRRVLVAAAGGGREVIALTRLGVGADGFDCSRAMVAAGQRAMEERGIRATLEWAAPCCLPERFRGGVQQDYDGLIVGWNGYTYISPPERRVRFLRELRSHVKPGSPILVSVAMRAEGRVALWTTKVANAVRVITFRRPVFTPGATFPGRPRQQFTRKQLEDELAEAGFRPVDFYKWGDFGAAVAISEL